MAFIKDMTGKRYGKLLVIKNTGKKSTENYIWECQCDCGNVCEVAQGNLKSGQVKSCGCNKRIPKGEAGFNHLYLKYRIRAEERGYSFELTKEEFRILTKQNCYYCGCEPKHLAGGKNSNGKYVYNGIDRWDNSKGYMTGNCVSCCGDCNKRKWTSDPEEFINWIRLAYNNLFNKNGDLND